MRPKGIANSKQLGLLTQVLERYCVGRGITDQEDRDRIASSILRLFDRACRLLKRLALHCPTSRPRKTAGRLSLRP